jgi:putative oxygen-independent coproporphyrinogen III oxidase
MTANASNVAVPLALYIHMPWCVRKCPYCDFNSHEAGGALPEQAYVDALLDDLARDLAQPGFRAREISSIFIGGGTPSLFSARSYDALFRGLHAQLAFTRDIEITLEANPGTVEQQKFRDYRALGINRLSIGVQSFNDQQLKALGRIHGRNEAIRAADAARQAGFDNFNLDLMHGLPGQSLPDALADLDQAIALAPAHLSWYQLTIEANTVFYTRPPRLPDDEALADIEDAGFSRLNEAGYTRYEISAFAQAGKQCRHNRNYWEFGDYLALGAGAHGKLTRFDGSVLRYRKTRLPKDYLSASANISVHANPYTAEQSLVANTDLPFEFMLNVLRLTDGVDAGLFAARCGLPLAQIEKPLTGLRARGLLTDDAARIACTATGLRFLNDVVNTFAGE